MPQVEYDDGDVRRYRMAEKKWYLPPQDPGGGELQPRAGNRGLVGARFTFHPTSAHPYPSRFQSGTVVRVLAENGPGGAAGAASVADGTFSAELLAAMSPGGGVVGQRSGVGPPEPSDVGAAVVRPPLRVQWDVTGLEADVYYEDLEYITAPAPEPGEPAAQAASRLPSEPSPALSSCFRCLPELGPSIA